MDITVNRSRSGVVHVAAVSDLDIDTAPKLATALHAELAATPHTLTLDLGAVSSAAQPDSRCCSPPSASPATPAPPSRSRPGRARSAAPCGPPASTTSSPAQVDHGRVQRECLPHNASTGRGHRRPCYRCAASTTEATATGRSYPR